MKSRERVASLQPLRAGAIPAASPGVRLRAGASRAACLCVVLWAVASLPATSPAPAATPPAPAPPALAAASRPSTAPAPGTAALRAASPTKRPNIIVLLSDTHRADYLGAYGFDGDISPNLDRLARSSVLFTHAITQAPWTKPAVASLFTSLHPLTHRVVDHEGKYWRKVGSEFKTSALPESAVTLAEALRAAGYRTAGWVANGWITEGLGFAQGFESYHSAKLNTNIYHAKEIWEPAWEWLAATRQDGRPFFLYLHFMDTHGPWRWSEEDYLALLGSPSLVKDTPPGKLEEASRPLQSRDIDFPGFDTRTSSWRAVYASRVRSLDRQLGRLFEQLAATGLMETTLIVFTADHGEELMNHTGWGHGGSLFEHQVRVPLIIRPPGGVAGGRTVDRPVSLIDLMPTLLAAAGVRDAPGGMQGEDLWQVVRSNRSQPGREWAFAAAVRHDPRIVSVQDSRYKLIREPAARPARLLLFDLEADPGETRDLSGERPEILKRLRKALDRQMMKLEKTGTLLEARGDLTQEEVEKLRSLGYID